jgi:hypothetical protein
VPVRIGPCAVAVVIPARDEEDGIEACLGSVRAALGRLPDGVASVVTVVLDRCVDRTPDLVESRLAGWPDAVSLHVGAGRRRPSSAPVHIVAGCGVGALRDLGVRDALARLGPVHPSDVWVLCTDADTTVPADWAREHLRLAAAGAAGVAGMADLAARGPLSRAAVRRHDEIVRELLVGPSHGHVYGANLGVRGDAYLAVGGFPAEGPGEDHGLWAALSRAGYPLVAPTALRVRTSPRTVGRARGGLADLLQSLHDAPPAG